MLPVRLMSSCGEELLRGVVKYEYFPPTLETIMDVEDMIYNTKMPGTLWSRLLLEEPPHSNAQFQMPVCS